jgi:Tfp pilus assembly protein PilF
MNSYAIFLKNQMMDFKASAAMYERAIAVDPKRGDIHYNYAILLYKDIKDHMATKEHLESTIRLDPGHKEAKIALERLLKRKFKDGKLKTGFLGSLKK